MNGVAMLLKSLGLDPEDIQKKADMLGKMALELKAQMDRIEAQQKAILDILVHNHIIPPLEGDHNAEANG